MIETLKRKRTEANEDAENVVRKNVSMNLVSCITSTFATFNEAPL